MQTDGARGVLDAASDLSIAVTGDQDGALRLWDVPGGRELPPRVTVGVEIKSVAMSPNPNCNW